MPTTIKVAAITEPKRYAWKVLIEVDHQVLYGMTGKSENDTPPSPGTVFDIEPHIERMRTLHSREADARQLGELLLKLQPAPPKEEGK